MFVFDFRPHLLSRCGNRCSLVVLSELANCLAGEARSVGLLGVPFQPKIAFNWATVAPAFAARVAAILRIGVWAQFGNGFLQICSRF